VIESCLSVASLVARHRFPFLAVACAHGRLVAVIELSLDVMALSSNIWLPSLPQLPPAPGLAVSIAFERNLTGMSS
jgi:hypothetical protein